MKRISYWDEVAAGFTWQGRERTLLNILDARLQAALDGDTSPAALPKPQPPELPLPTPPPATPHVTRCPQCKREVPLAETVMMPNGLVCDRCAG